jgi:RNA-directed DNA polymerase
VVYRVAAPRHRFPTAGGVLGDQPEGGARGGVGWAWRDYGRDLEARLADLHERVASGRYRATPSRRAYIPKVDGRLRPWGIASWEDKIVARAVVEVLNAVYEVDFTGFS